jgi:hypothetical protein
MLLPQGDELGAETEADDRDVETVLVHGGSWPADLRRRPSSW